MAHKLDNLYEGRPIYVISTGTSLRGFNFARLDGKITIGINRVIEYYHPTIVHFVDYTARFTHAEALRHFNGMIITGRDAGPVDTHDNTFEIDRNVDTFELSGDMTELVKTVGRSFSDGWYGGGGGCTALHSAILLGGNPIYLLGFDYYEDNGRHFDEYDESKNKPLLYDVSLEGVQHLSRQEWIPQIYNCNPKSLLSAFPFVDIDTVLPVAAEESERVVAIAGP